MTPADLDLVIAHTGHCRYRELTADDHPDREFYRRRVTERAAELRGEPAPREHERDPVPDPAARRAAKPRVPLGVPQSKG